jgi:hypothetical protein
MKLLTSLLIFSIASISLNSQSIFIENGKSISGFEFQNSQQEPLENLHTKTKTYISIGYEHELKKVNNLSIQLGLTHNSYGANGSDGVFNNYFEWNVDYLGLQSMLKYIVIDKYDWDIFLRLGASAEFFLKGNQTINNQVLNLKGVEEFDNIPIFIRTGLGASYRISTNTKLYISYSYGQSFELNDNSNNSSAANQQQSKEALKILNNQLGLGLIFRLK